MREVPSRPCAVTASGRPLAVWTTRARSSQYCTGLPSTAVMRSPVRSPACPAGAPSVTRPTSAGATGRPMNMNIAAAMSTASTKFIAGPAKTIMNRAASDLLLKALAGSTVGALPPSSGFSSSPIIFT